MSDMNYNNCECDQRENPAIATANVTVNVKDAELSLRTEQH